MLVTIKHVGERFRIAVNRADDQLAQRIVNFLMDRFIAAS